mmetsp:Transcript_5496/g.9523  ORF Transcript_5496/g.9523 Transcript_5496/m.9523 type:complete len:334 (+) Transcript_5496:71-1072(+)|eukprot:CAMPEP_0196652666 /NCGR_PEP_ID=MMETSP1086-20130531/2011_1 /TAXON_ID=77921 /ORGANISM="Cyanoptyche  gloeocystis , Strain SAG4.97" /LENGTH=333 /DNA_ID=CAMNT_0041983325 /DNA_START=69 /DNA_END=1070 /DNA_ORIENTATION=+
MATTADDFDKQDPSGERTFSQHDLATVEMMEDASCSVKPRRGACFWKAKRLKKKEAKAKAAGTSNSSVAEDMAGPNGRQSGSSGSNGEAGTRDTQEGPGAKRRKRKRNRVRLYKKYSEMTWEEKKAKEEAEEKKAQAKDVEVPLVVPRSDRGGRQGRAAQRPAASTFRPHAPRNTTQFLIDEKGHTSSAGEIGAPDLDEWMLDNAFGSMHGVLKKPLVRMSMDGDIEFNESDNSHSADSGPSYSHLMDQLKEKDAYIKLLEDTTDSLTRELNRLRSFLGPDHPFLADAPTLPPYTAHQDSPTGRVLAPSWTSALDSAPEDAHRPLSPPSLDPS